MGDFKLVKHNMREHLRSQLITTLIARRPRHFVGMHYHANSRLINARIASFPSELEGALLRAILARALRTAIRAYQRGLITSPLYLYCKATDETEEHILLHCKAWSHACDTHIQQVHALAAKIPQLHPFLAWSPCLKISGLAPDLPAPINRQVEEHALPFILALHTMFVSVLAARKYTIITTPSSFRKSA